MKDHPINSDGPTTTGAAGLRRQRDTVRHVPARSQVRGTLTRLGRDRAELQYPFGDLHRSGATLAMGSDWGEAH